MEDLKSICESIGDIISSIKKLHLEYRKYYFTFGKSYGMAEWDMKFGGIILRLEEVRKILSSYISGEITIIPELEEERLPIVSDKVGKIISYMD